MLTATRETATHAYLTESVCHQVIAALAPRTLTPSTRTLIAAVDAALPHLERNHARAIRQNAAGAAAAYFRQLLPPVGWVFHGHAVWITGDVSLLWRHPDGSLLLDAVHGGRPQTVHTTQTLHQTRQILSDGRDTYGQRLLGVRLLSTSMPTSSLFVSPHTPAVALSTTTYVRPWSL